MCMAKCFTFDCTSTASYSRMRKDPSVDVNAAAERRMSDARVLL